MEIIDVTKPSKEVQIAAQKSFQVLAATLQQLHSENPEIEIEETEERIKIPLSALKLLAKILEEMSLGNPISIVPIATEMTTQAASELLGCSRTHIVKLLEKGDIPFIKIGKHRRIRYDDILRYKKGMKETQRRLLGEIMAADEETGLYDS